MTKEELNYIKDAFSQIIDDIAGNPDWHEAARAVTSDLGTLERKLEEKISSLPSNLDEAAREYLREYNESEFGNGGDDWDDDIFITFKAGAEWQIEQFEKNRLAACDAQTKEEYDMETAFVDKIIKEQHRTPTFSDAIKHGIEWMAGQGVTKDAVIGMETKDIFINVSGRTLDELNLCPGDKVVVQIRKKQIMYIKIKIVRREFSHNGYRHTCYDTYHGFTGMPIT